MKQLGESAASSLAPLSDSAVALSCADGSVSKGASVSVNWQRTSGFNPVRQPVYMASMHLEGFSLSKINVSCFNTHLSRDLVCGPAALWGVFYFHAGEPNGFWCVVWTVSLLEVKLLCDVFKRRRVGSVFGVSLLLGWMTCVFSVED